MIEACNHLKRRLIIVGDGRELEKLKRIAGPTIEFAHRASAENLACLYARCKALLFASNEDFGIVPIECQSYGRPVIAYGRGGAMETVVPNVTGLHFEEQTMESLVNAMIHFEKTQSQFEPERIQTHARSFSTSEFKKRFYSFVELCIHAKQLGRPWTELDR